MASLINFFSPTNPIAALMYATFGGILPALAWLWFWLQEDKLHPEPRRRIMLAFLGGMAIIPLIYLPEKYVSIHFGEMTNATLFFWSAIEETAKLAVAWFIAFRSRDYDKPIDAIEYLITVALGFSALENTLFILNPLLAGNIMQSFIVGNMRFAGASLLHVVSSATLGYFIGYGFYSSQTVKNVWRVVGLAVAIALHTAFNLSIMYSSGSRIFFVFGCVWVAAIGVLILFEKIKKVHN